MTAESGIVNEKSTIVLNSRERALQSCPISSSDGRPLRYVKVPSGAANAAIGTPLAFL